MHPRSERRRNMAFNRVKTCLFPTEKWKLKTRGERDLLTGVKSITVIDDDCDTPPSPKELMTEQNTARVRSVRGTIANNSSKGSITSGLRSEAVDGDQYSGQRTAGDVRNVLKTQKRKICKRKLIKISGIFLSPGFLTILDLKTS